MSPVAATLLFWFAALLCAVAQLALLRAALRAWRAAGAAPAGASAGRRQAELLWALLPAAGLALILFLTWRVLPSGR